jgi:hypothetical protein
MFKPCLLVLLLFFVLSGCCPIREKGLVKNLSSSIPEKQDPCLKDFGLIKAGEVAKHSFTIKNESKEVLNIKDVSTSCGCTVTEIKNKMLKPGESTLVDVKFDSKGYSGAVEQFVYVSTDSLDESLVRFIIKANVTK